MLWIDCLGVVGTTVSLLLEVAVSLVELTGICSCSVGVALLVKFAGIGLSTGKAGISGAGRFELKGL